MLSLSSSGLDKQSSMDQKCVRNDEEAISIHQAINDGLGYAAFVSRLNGLPGMSGRLFYDAGLMSISKKELKAIKLPASTIHLELIGRQLN